MDNFKELDEKQVAQLAKALFGFLDPERLTKRQFVEQLEQIVETIESFKKDTNSSLKESLETLTEFSNRIKSEVDTKAEEKGKLLDEKAAKILVDFANKMRQVDERMSKVRDGRDADIEVVVARVLAELKLPEYKEVTLDSPEEIRNKLEVLQGDDRLDKSAIRGLDEIFDYLDKKIDRVRESRAVFTGGMNNAVQAYDLTSQCNGVTKTFAVPRHRFAIMLVGTQFPIVYRKTTDWDTANLTLTLTAEVSAPETGQTLTFLYIK
jgi:hypothetical protein